MQYYGWALRNREALLPTRAQLDWSLQLIREAQAQLEGHMRIEYVVPDYYARFPKACMGGWGQKSMLINPSGDVLPCHAAGVIPEMHFDNIRQRRLKWIWEESNSFRRFRGEAWMPEPCRTCDRRSRDFGGCRCQAFLLTGDPSATDPVCSLAPAHGRVEAAVLQANAGTPYSNVVAPQIAWKYRSNPE